jgi:ribosomal protein S18 acetylase RimI-like enzyme
MTDTLPLVPVHIRSPHYGEMDACVSLVRDNWGDESADRCFKQFVEFWRGGEYAPEFFVATTYDAPDRIIGFSALRKSMLMNGFWEFIWIAVHKDHQGRGIGEMLTDYRLDVVRENDGASVLLVTQKPRYFNRFGFVTDREHGNGWHAMSCQLKLADMK